LDPLICVANERIIVTGMAVSCLQQFYSTKTASNKGVNLWTPNTQLWQMFLVISVDVISMIIATIILIAYSCGVKAADRWSDRTSNFSIFLSVIKAGAHVAVFFGIYSTAKNSNSLQGQTCGAPASKSALFPQFKFNRFCSQQVLQSFA
jgi:hypothetical protein